MNKPEVANESIYKFLLSCFVTQCGNTEIDGV